MHYAFGPYELDAGARRLTRGGQLLPVPDRHLDILIALLSRPGEIVSKDALIEAAWKDVAVTDNSLEQAISSLRRALETLELLRRPDAKPPGRLGVSLLRSSSPTGVGGSVALA